MRPWRDIQSMNAWRHIAGTIGGSTAKVGRVRQLRAVFDGDVNTPERQYDRMVPLITEYHGLEKRDAANIPARIRLLNELHLAADLYLSKFKVDMAQAKQRVQPTVVKGQRVLAPIKRDVHTQSFMSGDAVEQSFDRNMLTLRNRSLRKAGYLTRLNHYLKSPLADPKNTISTILSPQYRTATEVGPVAGVLLEKADPWHRPIELHFDKTGKLAEDPRADLFGINSAFFKWYTTVGQHNKPFLLWLEGEDLCTMDDKSAVAGTSSVAYGDYTRVGSAPPAFRLALVTPRQTMLMMEEFGGGDHVRTRAASTDGYTCNSGKGVNDAAAYIWTGKEIVIAQHQEGRFHHSSFNSANAVECAGMIKMANGRVTYVSNNSGHYRPSPRHLARFCEWLSMQRVIDRNTAVQCQGLADQYENTWDHFGKNWSTLKAR
jgi:hypothetical protein